jgi:hypothetical protein
LTGGARLVDIEVSCINGCELDPLNRSCTVAARYRCPVHAIVRDIEGETSCIIGCGASAVDLKRIKCSGGAHVDPKPFVAGLGLARSPASVTLYDSEDPNTDSNDRAGLREYNDPNDT